ncbi:hypothetical protein M3I54_05190 [Paraburkholderia sp. CNPSo 3274]|nr:hypothetical protein [Paraburkholderia sp. CNPSo 3274]MCP3706386.1 hypothetical protein [Paraburkholderia sp. CNPSo 3274]
MRLHRVAAGNGERNAAMPLRDEPLDALRDGRLEVQIDPCMLAARLAAAQRHEREMAARDVIEPLVVPPRARENHAVHMTAIDNAPQPRELVVPRLARVHDEVHAVP